MSKCKKNSTPAPAEEEAVKKLSVEELTDVAGGTILTTPDPETGKSTERGHDDQQSQPLRLRP